MNTHYYARVDRRDFGDLISEEGVSRLNIETVAEIDILEAPVSNAVIAVWSLDPKKTTQLPEVLICQDGTQNDWAAWITTFAARIRPFSAYMRLMTHTDFQRTAKRSPTPDIGPFTWPAAGLILGEVLGASDLPDKALETLSATAFASTLSFVMCRAAAIYADFQEWSHLVEMWESVREVTKQRTRSIESGSIARVCATVMDALGFQGASKILTRNDTEVSEACRYLFRSPQRTPSNLFETKIFADAEHMMRGSREDRVLAFEEFLHRSDGISVPKPEIMSFMLGYLASRIAPGTIRHSSVLGQVTHRYPTAVLWYGFCAGFAEGDANMPNASGRRGVDFPSSARRMIRELLRPELVLGAPICDIGYLELIALSRTGGDPLEGFIKTTQGSIIVELLPGVCTSVSVSSKPPAESQVRELRGREIIERMGKQIERLCETYKDFLAAKAPGSEAEQRSLFPTRRKKK
ncbi:MAG: hypothetical protein JRJ38_13130 [Deltaproteobacteria bacterium]|nr:hypothetical protein [Deltaproteobacteria bacterium]